MQISAIYAWCIMSTQTIIFPHIVRINIFIQLVIDWHCGVYSERVVLYQFKMDSRAVHRAVGKQAVTCSYCYYATRPLFCGNVRISSLVITQSDLNYVAFRFTARADTGKCLVEHSPASRPLVEKILGSFINFAKLFSDAFIISQSSFVQAVTEIKT